MKHSSPLVYIVIPNKNGTFHLQYSLKYLAQTTYENYKIVLVDNGSTDDSLQFVSNNFSDITVLKNKGKKGFAGGVNTGIKWALAQNAEYIAVFSNDIKILPNWIELTLPLFEVGENLGLIGFTEIAKENEELFYNTSVSKNNIRYEKVRAVAGCLYICSANLFREIGYLDEDYYMYGEDNDWFYRIAKSRFKMIETNIPVWHYGEGSAGKNKFMPTWYSYRNALRFSLKNESLFGVARMLLSLINQGCNIFLKADHPSFKRLRRYNPVINFGLIVASIFWNLFHIIPTMKSRYSSNTTAKS
jgi:hypothetical protein